MNRQISLKDTAGNTIFIEVHEKCAFVRETGENQPARRLEAFGESMNHIQGKGAGYGFMLLAGNSLSCLDQPNYERLIMEVKNV